jgi:hypothetical protein
MSRIVLSLALAMGCLGLSLMASPAPASSESAAGSVAFRERHEWRGTYPTREAADNDGERFVLRGALRYAGPVYRNGHAGRGWYILVTWAS